MKASMPHNITSASSKAQAPILDKFLAKGEWILLHVALCALLLPPAAQALTTGLLGLSLLFRQGWSRLDQAWSHEASGILRGAWQTFRWGLYVLWASLGLSLLVGLYAGLGPRSELFVEMARLVGKQGFYGMFLILGFLLAGFQTRLRGDWRINPWVPLMFTIVLTLYMLGQRYWGWDWVHGFDAKIGPHRYAYGVYRAAGFMAHPLTLAYNAMLLSVISLGHGLWLLSLRERRGARLWLLLSAFLLLVILLSGSRFPLLMTLGLQGIALILWWGPSVGQPWRVLLPLGLFVFGGLIVSFEPQLRGRFLELWSENVDWTERFDRLVFWQVHLRMAMDHPWLGTGLYRYDQLLLDYYNQAGYTEFGRKYSAHNIFLQTFADLGLLGLGGVLALLLGVTGFARRLWRGWRHPAAWLLLAAIILSGLLQNNLRDSEFLFALWVSIGLLTYWILEAVTRVEPAESTTNRRAHFKDHQSGENRTDHRPDVRGSHAGPDSNAGQ